MTEPLINYKEGWWTHPEMVRFCNGIGERIRDLVNSDHKIETIIVTGHADGFPNKGVRLTQSDLPPRCQLNGLGGTVDDVELATLRGCLVWSYLIDSLGPEYGVSIFGEAPAYYDEPDWGKRGDAHRKVTVEVIYGK